MCYFNKSTKVAEFNLSEDEAIYAFKEVRVYVPWRRKGKDGFVLGTPQIESPVQNKIWRRRRMVAPPFFKAQVTPGSWVSPDEYGIYSFKTERQTVLNRGPNVVVARVKIWGRVVEYKGMRRRTWYNDWTVQPGYVSEHAEVVELIIPPHSARRVLPTAKGGIDRLERIVAWARRVKIGVTIRGTKHTKRKVLVPATQ